MDERLTIYVVFKTHFDIGYTELAKEVIEGYGSKMLPDVIETCEGTQDFGDNHKYVWTMSAWPLIQSLKPEIAQTEVIVRAKELIKHGQIAWHALPFTTHTEFCGLEEFIRGMYFSRQLSEEYGKWPISAKMTDVPGHTWILPSLLYKAGVRFLHLGCNPGCTPPEVPRLFLWEGPDGNRILTFYNKGCYGSSLFPPADWKFPVWLALMQTNDNVGPQKPEFIDEILNNVSEKFPDAKVVIGTMDDFYKDMEQYLDYDIPVIKGDLADTWIHGVGSYPKEVKKLRALRRELIETEKLLSVNMLDGILDEADMKNCKIAIDKAFELCLLFGEHTWGLDVKTTTGYNRRYAKKDFAKDRNLPTYIRMEESWEEQKQRVDHAEKELKNAMDLLKNSTVGLVDAPISGFTVFNGLGWKRNAWVDIEEYSQELKEIKLVDVNTGEFIETAIIDERLKAFIKDLPACGYKSLVLQNMTTIISEKNRIYCSAKHGVIENSWFRVEVDNKRGCIKSLKDKSTGKEWVEESVTGFGQYRYDIYGIDDITEFIRSYSFRFYDWLVNDLGRMSYPSQEHLIFIPEGFTVESEVGTASASLVLRHHTIDQSIAEYGNAHDISTRITLYRDQPFIDLSFGLVNKQETPFIEAGHFVFPLNIKNHTIAINKLGCILNPEKDIIKDANNSLYCCEHWVDVSDGEQGMAFIPYDTPLFSIGDQEIYKYRREFEKRSPALLFNAFNNSWGTNFPQWMGGDYSFKFRLIPHKGDWRDGDIAKLALEAVTPVLIGYERKGNQNKDKLNACYDLVYDLCGMEIMALKPAENRKGLIIRLREFNGIRRKVGLSLSHKFRNVLKCDLLENPVGDEDLDINKLTFSTEPFEIHTFFLGF